MAIKMRKYILIPVLLLYAYSHVEAAAVRSVAAQFSTKLPHIIFPKANLAADELGVIVNSEDPESIEVGKYYIHKRQIPRENIYTISFNPEKRSIKRKNFEKIYLSLADTLPAHIQALVLTWTNTYRVECMSITSAFAFGFDEAYCASGCKRTRANPYFDSTSIQPFTDFGIRPTMMLAGDSVHDMKKLIDRGVLSDSTYPEGTAYLVKTSDKARNTRAYVFNKIDKLLGQVIKIEIVNSDYINNKTDVLFYFTGSRSVPYIDSNRYLPGAITDHLTSSGGVLQDSKQMSLLRWLEAGATASYGTVVEPCNFPQKFPNPGVVISHYLGGKTLIEAYWKSVKMPGQGLFVGEALAKPFGGYKLEKSDDVFILTTFSLRPGSYELYSSEYTAGPYRTRLAAFEIEDVGINKVHIPVSSGKFLKLIRARLH